MSKYVKSFTPFYESGWENQPSENTPIMGEALDAYDSSIVKIEGFLENFEPNNENVPTKVSELENDIGYVYASEETDSDDIVFKEFLPYPKDESGNPIAGSENQILMSDEDGSTKWGEASSVSFFQTELKNVNVNVYSDVTIDTLRLPKGVYIISAKCYYEGTELRYVQRLKAPVTFTNNSGYDPAGNVLLSLTGTVELTEETDVIYQVYLNKENVTTIMLKDIQIKAIKLS